MSASLTSAAVLGFGTMGQGIVRLLVTHGVVATVLDVDADKARATAARLATDAVPGARICAHATVPRWWPAPRWCSRRCRSS
jgi:3-hydroxyisobutyrate dehydrogenase-like beta-hydroxyacid dehydrogenase